MLSKRQGTIRIMHNYSSLIEWIEGGMFHSEQHQAEWSRLHTLIGCSLDLQTDLRLNRFTCWVLVKATFASLISSTSMFFLGKPSSCTIKSLWRSRARQKISTWSSPAPSSALYTALYHNMTLHEGPITKRTQADRGVPIRRETNMQNGVDLGCHTVHVKHKHHAATVRTR